MNRKLIYCVSIISLYLLVLVPAASAHHHIWLVHDSAKQLSAYSGDETRASWWMINGVVTTYRSNSSTISSNVTTAVNNWNAQIPQVKIAGSGYDLVFDYSDSVCSAGSGGCHAVAAVYIDPIRKANFTTKSSITITSNSSNRTRTAAHEIGHYIGLHERYRDDGSTGTFCSSENTVMNGGDCHTNTGPTSLDKFRVDNFLGNGYASNITITSPSLKPSVPISLASFGRGSYRVEVTPYFKSYDQFGVATNSSSYIF